MFGSQTVGALRENLDGRSEASVGFPSPNNRKDQRMMVNQLETPLTFTINNSPLTNAGHMSRPASRQLILSLKTKRAFGIKRCAVKTNRIKRKVWQKSDKGGQNIHSRPPFLKPREAHTAQPNSNRALIHRWLNACCAPFRHCRASLANGLECMQARQRGSPPRRPEKTIHIIQKHAYEMKKTKLIYLGTSRSRFNIHDLM